MGKFIIDKLASQRCWVTLAVFQAPIHALVPGEHDGQTDGRIMLSCNKPEPLLNSSHHLRSRPPVLDRLWKYCSVYGGFLLNPCSVRVVVVVAPFSSAEILSVLLDPYLANTARAPFLWVGIGHRTSNDVCVRR